MNKKIGAIVTGPTLVCKKCVEDNNHIITEWALSIGYPDGYTCDDCGDVYTKNGNISRKKKSNA